MVLHRQPAGSVPRESSSKQASRRVSKLSGDRNGWHGRMRRSKRAVRGLWKEPWRIVSTHLTRRIHRSGPASPGGPAGRGGSALSSCASTATQITSTPLHLLGVARHQLGQAEAGRSIDRPGRDLAPGCRPSSARLLRKPIERWAGTIVVVECCLAAIRARLQRRRGSTTTSVWRLRPWGNTARRSLAFRAALDIAARRRDGAHQPGNGAARHWTSKSRPSTTFAVLSRSTPISPRLRPTWASSCSIWVSRAALPHCQQAVVPRAQPAGGAQQPGKRASRSGSVRRGK